MRFEGAVVWLPIWPPRPEHAADEPNPLFSRHFNSCSFKITYPDSRPLQVLHNRNRAMQTLRSSANRDDRRTVRVVRAMREVQAGHVHPAVNQPFEYGRFGAGRTNRTHNFSFSHEGGITGEQAVDLYIVSWNTQARTPNDLVYAHSSKRVAASQSISAIRLTLAH